ncbi:MAG: hypothetical protein WCK01_05200 [Candidatus Uhrbacteria bacterium]
MHEQMPSSKPVVESAKPMKTRVEYLSDQWDVKFKGKSYTEIEAVVVKEGGEILVGNIPESLPAQAETHAFALRLNMSVGREGLKRMAITAIHEEKIDVPQMLSPAYVLRAVVNKKRHELDDKINAQLHALGEKGAIVKLFTAGKDKAKEESLRAITEETRKASLEFNDAMFRPIVSELVKIQLRKQGPEEIAKTMERLEAARQVFETKLNELEQKYKELSV